MSAPAEWGKEKLVRRRFGAVDRLRCGTLRPPGGCMPRILRVAALSALALVVASIAELPASMQELEIATSVSMLEGPTVDAKATSISPTS